MDSAVAAATTDKGIHGLFSKRGHHFLPVSDIGIISIMYNTVNGARGCYDSESQPIYNPPKLKKFKPL